MASSCHLKAKIRGNDGIEETLEAVGLAAPVITQTERPRERSVPELVVTTCLFCATKAVCLKRNHPMGWRLARRKMESRRWRVNAVGAASMSGSIQTVPASAFSPTTSRDINENSQLEGLTASRISRQQHH